MPSSVAEYVAKSSVSTASVRLVIVAHGRIAFVRPGNCAGELGVAVCGLLLSAPESRICVVGEPRIDVAPPMKFMLLLALRTRPISVTIASSAWIELAQSFVI